MATRGIVWKTIVPYAPWQGGLYERTIKSIKPSLYNVLQRKVPDEKTLETLSVEIEGCINTRPLTYQEEKWNETPALRLIDFIQRDVVVTYPCEFSEEDKTDPDYLPADGAVILQTRQQTEEALKTSYQLIEHFRRIWSQQYLTALRESHKLHISNKRGTLKTSSVGNVVLIAELLAPRSTWKMGRSTKTDHSHNDVSEM
ncbi:unnamed protein product [Haemonchus placei]|uniref:DUF5641 domain-containing protein n=1 Tax=Haemonchus placei TaxID=6290 RepID=A0A0N4WEG4_HAEPC|nr:unnamed protein product [Haemonchus placei]